MKIFRYPVYLIILSLIAGCGASKKFTENENNDSYIEDNNSIIRVLLDEKLDSFSYTADEPVILKDELKTIVVISKGNIIQFKADGNKVKSITGNKEYSSKFFQILPEDKRSVNFNDKKYSGSFRIASRNNKIQIINTVTLEEYLKGVVPSEMPVGKGTDNYEALRAFSICARTYAVRKLNSNNNFDIYSDVRDQVYGGEGSERTLSNKAIRESRGLILTYNNVPAVTFYHSTCGGFTEDGANVFSVKNAPYLQSIKDGEEPLCVISPRFAWTEFYSGVEFIQRLKAAGLVSGFEWKLDTINVNTRFKSGRVNELQITLKDDENNQKIVRINGNNIRKIIRSSDNSSILNSTLFDIRKDDNDNVTIIGRGYGHGVGLCQYGAMNLSRMGKDYNYILSHYYPGTIVTRYYD
jgi:stage II sporulation protein D